MRTEKDYLKEYDFKSRDEAHTISEKILEHFNVNEFTFEDLSTDLLYIATYLQTILVHADECELDELSKSNLENAIDKINRASSEVFFADDYFRQYSFIQFAECIDNRLRQ